MDAGAGKKPRGKRILKRVLIALAVAVGLLIVLVAAGVAYVYYFGATPATVTAPTAPKPQTSITTRPAAIPEDAKVGVSVQTISSPVKPGDNSYVAIRTLEGSTCSIDVRYNNVKSTDSGLIEKTADEYGTASWSWTVGADTPLGSWPVAVTCVRNKQSGSVTATLVVSRDTEN